MESDWARSQREGILCQLYGVDSSDGVQRLPHQAVQSQVVGAIDDFLFHQISPKDTAIKIAWLITSQEDINTP